MISGIVGQECARSILDAMAASGAIPHTLLFVGPYGVGKGETAFEFARMLLCEHGLESGCTSCNACYRASKLEHPDLHLLFPFRPLPKKAGERGHWVEEFAKHKELLANEPYAPVLYEKNKQIVRDLVDEVRDRLRESSFEGGRKVCIILGAERLNKATSNSLLKILEEPPDGVHFLLTTERLSSVLPTIVSRSSVVRFRRLRVDEIQAYLEERGSVDPESAASYAREAGGSLKTAKALAFENKADVLSHSVDLYRTVAGSGLDDAVSQAFSFAWSRDIVEAEELINGFSMCTRSVLKRKLGLPPLEGLDDDSITGLSKITDIHSLNRLSLQLEEGLEMLGRNVNVSTIMTTVFYGIHDTYLQE